MINTSSRNWNKIIAYKKFVLQMLLEVFSSNLLRSYSMVLSSLRQYGLWGLWLFRPWFRNISCQRMLAHSDLRSPGCGRCQWNVQFHGQESNIYTKWKKWITTGFPEFKKISRIDTHNSYLLKRHTRAFFKIRGLCWHIQNAPTSSIWYWIGITFICGMQTPP